MMPVLLILPLWAIVYMGAFAEQESTEPLTGVALGAQVYSRAGCGGCHGAQGQGGVGPRLAAGEVALTFPDMEAHVEFVKQGSGPIRGQPYGDPGRPGGPHVAASGGMPGFGTQLSDEEIRAVVQYEREGL
jgi:mono/diheme cytochrome c family protein